MLGFSERSNSPTRRRAERAEPLSFSIIGTPAVLDMIRTSGTIVTYGSTVVTEPKLPFYRMMFMDLLLRLVIVYAMPESAKQAAIDDIGKALSENRLQHRVSHIVPLDEIVHAHELIEKGGFRGCVVVETAALGN